MRAQRPQRAASKPRSHRFGAGVVRLLSVTAVAATACAMMAGAASAATAAPTAGTTPTTTAITNTVPGVIKVGASFTFDVSVTPAAATGTVTVASVPAGDGSCTATLTAGTGTCTVTPAEYGVIDFVATYGGDGTYATSASAPAFPLEVQNVTTTTVTASPSKAGPVTLSGAVYAMGANITDGMGSLAFYNGTTVIKGCAAVALKTFTTAGDNVGTCTTTLGAGTYTINVKYSGDEVNEASTGTGAVTLTKRVSLTGLAAAPKTAVVRQLVKLTATVRGAGGTPTGRVTLTWRGHVVCSARISRGSMRCLVKFLGRGTYLLRATYAGSSIYDASVGQVRVRVKR
jgi:hypothetical protein